MRNRLLRMIIFDLRRGTSMIETSLSEKKPHPMDNNIRSLKHASDSTKSPTWGGNIRKKIQASYDAKRLLRNDTFRPRRGGNTRTIIRACCGAKLPHRGGKIRAKTGEFRDEIASSG